MLILLRRRVSLKQQHWKILILVHNFFHSVSRNLPKSSSKSAKPTNSNWWQMARETISFSLFPKLSKCNNNSHQWAKNFSWSWKEKIRKISGVSCFTNFTTPGSLMLNRLCISNKGIISGNNNFAAETDKNPMPKQAKPVRWQLNSLMNNDLLDTYVQWFIGWWTRPHIRQITAVPT